MSTNFLSIYENLEMKFQKHSLFVIQYEHFEFNGTEVIHYLLSKDTHQISHHGTVHLSGENSISIQIT